MAPWTAQDIPDQAGRTHVVTGANSGIGYRAAVALARGGAHVVLACRSAERGEAALRRLRSEAPGASAALELLDLADLDSVRAFAGRLEAVDVLVNNAGVMALPRRRTAQGFEMQLGTNHLGHFALTGLVLDRLLDGRGPDGTPRVVTISSNAHRMGRVNFDNLDGDRRYFRWAAYGQAKLANLLFALELQRRADAAGARLVSTAAHPGYAATNLQYQASRETGNPLDRALNAVLNAVLAQSDAMGALPTLYAATVPDLPGGAYVGPDGPGEFRGHPRLTAPNGRARDPEVARRLWEVSEELTGVAYDFAAASAPA
jgi:NAD(P)-dependent dehydrogenase (short-subunit alcohol dehydrogenase family)